MAATATPRKLTMEELFIDAKSQGFTHQGEMFSAANMAQLAKSLVQPWFNVELLKGGLFTNYDYILRSLLEGALMLVPYPYKESKNIFFSKVFYVCTFYSEYYYKYLS